MGLALGCRLFDIHKIKPIHGWREFVGEVGIIVLGVLIALTAENLVERWRWHEEAEQPRAAIRAEIADSALNAWERLIVRPCLVGQLKVLADRLTATKGSWAPLPMKVTSQDTADEILPHTYQAPSREYVTDAWKNAVSTGAINHLRREEVAAFSKLYSAVGSVSASEDKEDAAAAKLTPLSFPQNLSAEARMRFIVDIDDTAGSLFLIDLDSEAYLKQVAELKSDFNRSNIRSRQATVLRGQREHRGECVRDLPLNLN